MISNSVSSEQPLTMSLFATQLCLQYCSYSYTYPVVMCNVSLVQPTLKMGLVCLIVHTCVKLGGSCKTNQITRLLISTELNKILLQNEQWIGYWWISMPPLKLLLRSSLGYHRLMKEHCFVNVQLQVTVLLVTCVSLLSGLYCLWNSVQ